VSQGTPASFTYLVLAPFDNSTTDTTGY